MNPWKGLKDLPHDMWALFFTSLINRSGTMVIPFLALYLTKKIGVTPTEAGTALLVYGAAAFIAAPLTGKLSDKIGSIKIMQFSLYGSGLLFFIYSFISDYKLILAATFVLAAVNEAFRPANLSLITEIVTPPQRRMAFALNRLAINAGMSIGPVIGGFLTLIDYHYLFYANAFASIAAGVYFNSVRWSSLSPAEADIVKEKPKIKFGILNDKHFLFFLFAIIPANLVFFQHLGALPLYIVNDLNYSTAAFGLFGSINTVLIIIAEVPLNNMMSNTPYRKSLMIGASLAGLGFGGFAIAGSTLPLIIAIIIFTFGEMIFFPTTAAYTSEITPPERRGEYMGYYQMTFSFAFSAGPWLGTVVYENFGSAFLWNSALFFGMITAVLMFFIKEKNPSNENGTD
ncbi:MAG: MFS transporter [Chlorobi bacterium]|jgi:predicted MFS family arabinose efflux permease|nr:MFS transporter [Ignavibacteriota bacterium]MBL1161227.1 MFS transporter [Chlorobiota bacterium]MCO6446801.1 MFS transporter [Ignavibacterium album]MCZ2267388.1 MFS transporter [Ignavibacteriales bacterium]MCZ7609564.1 MFS transporter [Ignavibacterium sp.]MDX9713348.1 MFS transporter [Ignavibacteriaceae bacterium]